jgi:hypothetical protein
VRWVASSHGIGSAVEEARWWRRWRCSCMHEARVGLGLHAGRVGSRRSAPTWRGCMPPAWVPALSPAGLGKSGEPLVTAGRLGTQVGRVAFKRRVTLLEGDRVFALPYASCLSTFQAPSGWGISTVFPLRRWGNATPRELVPFSRRSASKIFIMQPGCTPPPVVTQDGDHQLDGGEKRTGLLPPPRPQLQGSSSPLLGRRVRRVGRPPPRGSVTLFFPRRLGEKGISQLRGGFP